MEAAGLAIGVVGLVSLFNSCLESLAKAQSYRSSKTDSHVLNTRFRAARARFEQWGVSVGISQGKLTSDHHPAFDKPDTAEVVEDILHIVIKAICDGIDSHRGKAIESFHRNEPQAASSVQSRRTRLRWALGGKEERIEKVEIFEKLVQQLYNLVPPISKGDEHADRFDGKEWSDDPRQMLSKIEREMQAEVRREVYSWLGKSPASDRYEDSIKKRVDSTCNWLLDRPVFKSWLSTPASLQLNLLWINGPAGFGKTILCAHIVDYLSNLLRTPVAYFFFTSDHESREDPYLALRSWIWQVVSHHDAAFECVHEAWEEDFGEVASRRALVKLFKTIVGVIPGSIFVADGLDECANLGNGDGSVAEFLSDITNVVSDSDVRLLFMSRDEPEIRNALVDNSARCFAEYRITLEDVRSDTAAFSESIVDRRLSNKSGDFRSTISQAMTERCQGQFLWLKMQEESLRKGMSKKRLHEVVENTPSGLDRLYDHNWARITEMAQWERDRAIALLRWTAFATGPLTVYEITEAVLMTQFEELEPDEYPDTLDEDYIRTEIVGLCGPLIEINQPLGATSAGHRTIHIPHFSVRQYLLHQLPIPKWIQQNFQLQTSYERLHHTVLARACLQYVSLPEVWKDGRGGIAYEDNFHHYAATSWFSHVETGLMVSTILELSTELFNGENPVYNHFAKYVAGIGSSELPEELDLQLPLNPLEYVLVLGWAEMAILLVNESNVNEIGWRKMSPVFSACSSGMTEVVHKFLQVGANLTVVDSSGRTPLHLAAWGGSEDIIRILVEHGAYVSAQDVDGLTPLHYASLKGNLRACQYLVRNGANLTTATHEGRNPLHLACAAGHSDVVKLILQNGPKSMVTDAHPTSGPPLHFASISDSIETVRVLLEHGAQASIASSDSDGWTPLMFASHTGQVAMAQLLLDWGAEATIAIPDDFGWTSLHVAAATENDNNELVELLLRYGARVTISTLDDEGCTPLFRASECGHQNIVKLLLQHQGQDLEAILQTTNKALVTPLLAASRNGHIEVVKELLNYGAEQTITIQDSIGETPLYAAADRGESEIVNLLLSHGAEASLEITDVRGETPLYSASKKGHERVVKVLLEQGAETTIAIVDENRETPLYVASSRGRIEIVRQLLDHGACTTIATQDVGGETPLYCASISGSEEIAQLLLEYGAESTISIVDKLGETPLYAASNRGDVNIVKKLLLCGAKATIPTQNVNGETALYVAAIRNYPAVVKLLLDTSPAHCNIPDYVGCTPLFIASRYGFLEVVELLLSTDFIDLDATDWKGSSPLFAAVANGHLHVVKLLISRGASINSWAPVGQSLLWWAQRAGNPDLIRLLEQQDALKDASTPETSACFEPLPDDAKSVIYDSSLGWCDVCTLTLHEGQSYGCVECTHSYLLVCPECFHRGFRLCRERHALVPQ